MGISAYSLSSNWYFPRERKSAITTRRPNATLCIKFNDQKSCQIFGCPVAQYLRHNKYPSKKQSTKLMLTLLLISGNVDLNLGPTNIKYPCGECARVVNFGPSIACDQCSLWYHQDCAGINSTIFECYTNATIEMQWAYIKYGLPNISLLFQILWLKIWCHFMFLKWKYFEIQTYSDHSFMEKFNQH